ncbi:MAG: hypothetical protein ACYDBB_09135 [Armatimonadota bacterium]
MNILKTLCDTSVRGVLFAIALSVLMLGPAQQVSMAADAGVDTVVQRFTLTERFGVSHPDQIVDFDLPAGVVVDPKNSYLVSPRGDEVAYQLIEGGRKIAIETHLPASVRQRPACRLYRGIVNDPGFAHSFAVSSPYFAGEYYFAPGCIVRFSGQTVPAPFTPGKDYFVKERKYHQQTGYRWTFSEAPGGPAVPVTTDPQDSTYITPRTLIVDVATSRIYAFMPGLRDGDPLRFTTAGQLPAPLVPGKTYYACKLDGGYFKLSETSVRPGTEPKTVTFTSAGTGEPEIEIAWTWELRSGKAPAAATPVVVVAHNGQWEITNGITGVRVPTGLGEGGRVPAPIQAFRLKDGAWSGDAFNEMERLGSIYDSVKPTLKNYTVTFVEKGPVRVVVDVVAIYDRPMWVGWPQPIKSVNPKDHSFTLAKVDMVAFSQVRHQPVVLRTGEGGKLPAPLKPETVYYPHLVSPGTYTLSATPGGLPIQLTSELVGTMTIHNAIPGGEGRHATRITLDADQPSIGVEDDSNVELTYAVPIAGFTPDQVRYQGHSAGNKAYGRDAAGNLYSDAYHNHDAYSDLRFDKYYSPERNTPLYLNQWNPWAGDSGWYTMLYGKDAGLNANVVGLFHGRPSRAIGLTGTTAGFFTRPEAPQSGLSVRIGYQGPSANLIDRHRLEWFIWVGDQKTALPESGRAPIKVQQNLYAGLNLNKLQRIPLTFPDPKQGYGSPFMPRTAVDKIIERIRTEPAYRQKLETADPASKELIAFWADATGERASKVVDTNAEIMRDLVHALVHEEGNYTFRYEYWHGGGLMNDQLLWIDQVLASPLVTPQAKEKLKTAAMLYGTIMWDDDFVPMDNCAPFNMGTPNMPTQQAGARNQFAMILSGLPAMKPRVAAIVDQVNHVLRNDIAEDGGHLSSIHYIGAGMMPTLSVMQALKNQGVKDFFKDEPRVTKFAEFLLQCTTPPEPRFANLRANIAVGDGPTEGNSLFGILATGFADVNPKLSQRLMGMWVAQSSVHGNFHGTTLLKINQDLPTAEPGLASADFPGYFTILRNKPGTAQETAVWMINGNHSWDHSHYDIGELVIYALGAPLSLDWGSQYEPHIFNSIMHSLALPEKLLYPNGWQNADSATAQQEAGRWGTYGGTKTTARSFQRRDNGSWGQATIQSPGGDIIWTRTMTLAELGTALPVIVVQDTYAGTGATGAKVATLNLVAAGAVETPDGTVKPLERTWQPSNIKDGKKEYPSVGEVFLLPTGVNRLRFTGQSWVAHPTGGIDWDLYVVADEDQEAYIGNWAHQFAGPLGMYFQQANGKPFEERQHILRIRGNQGFTFVIVPYLKGHRPTDLTVKTDGNATKVSSGGKSIRVVPDGSFTTR